MILQRLRDWRHERYISRISWRCLIAMQAKDRAKTSLYWSLMVSAIKRRSPQQVARMERDRGIA